MNAKFFHHQGAALIVSMILLTTLTLLALSTTQIATAELTLAGNEQFQARAVEAADAGIEQIIATHAFITDTETAQSASLSNGDSYVATVRPRGKTAPLPGYTLTFIAEHFEIESTGMSLRDARATHVQGVFVVRAAPPATAVAGATGTPPLCHPGIEIRKGICAPEDTVIRTYWYQQ